VPPPLVPRSGVCDSPIPLLTYFSFLAPVHEREDRSRHDGYIRTSDDLEQPKRVRDLFVAPLVPAYHSDPEYFDLRDWIIIRSVCRLLPPGPAQSWSIITLRRG